MKNVIMITYIFALLLPTHLYASVEPVFHEAKTEAEMRLNHILTLAKNDHNMFDCVIGSPDCDREKDTYDELFTHDLRTVFSNEEKEQVLYHCGGVYKTGEQCSDWGCNPITCQQDYPEKYLFRTLEQNEKMAIIESSWTEYEDSKAKYPKYQLIKEGATWRIDGTHCGGTEGFNMNAEISSK